MNHYEGQPHLYNNNTSTQQTMTPQFNGETRVDLSTVPNTNVHYQAMMSNQQGMTLQAMQQMMMQQQQQQQQHQQQYQLQQQYLQARMVRQRPQQQQPQQQQQLAPQQILSYRQQQQPQAADNQQMLNQPMHFQSNNITWTTTNQANPSSVTSSFSSDEHSEVIAAKMAPALGELRSITSQGMLLPLVKMPSQNQLQQEENPKQQMHDCMNVIEEALQDPSLADAGKFLLKAMQASSSYMSDILQSKKQQLQEQLQVRKQVDVPQLAPLVNLSDKLFFVGSSMQCRGDPVKEESCSTFPSAQQLPSHQQVLDPLVLIPASVTPVLSATPHPQHVPRSKTPPDSRKQPKPTVHKASCGRVEKSSYKHQQTQEAPKPRKNSDLSSFEGSPHKFLLAVLHERGYPTLRVTSKEAGYQTDPSHLQLASFGTTVVKAVHSSDAHALSKLIGCGLSPNPCNQFGDSILSLICKRADYNVFQVLVNHGCDLQVSDSFGRTSLHNLAWASKFSGPMTKVILDNDLHQLLVEDKQGQCPLEYVRKDNWGEWIAFLKDNMDLYWPIAHDRPIQPLPRDSRGGPIVDPISAVSTELAVKISSGQVSPDDAVRQSNPQPPAPSLDFSLF